MQQVTVIGGGASGMTAAITAASLGAGVTLLEQNDRVGKKILSTGNGRCNYTNLHQEPSCYHSGNPEFPWGIVQQFDAGQTVDFFERLGIVPMERDGYLYPHSGQASAVLEVLRMECRRLQVEIRTGWKCEDILPQRQGFLIKSSQGRLRAGKVILAAGSKASRIAGSDGSGYELAKRLGHRITPVLPALVQLRCAESFYKGIAGTRIQGEAAVFAEERCIARDRGEIQLTDYGISGIPVFQVSGAAAQALQEKKQVRAVLNFMPSLEEAELLELLERRAQARPEKTLEEFFIGIFPKKLWELWIRQSGLSKTRSVNMLTRRQWKVFVRLIRQFETRITGTNDFAQAQVCRGGVDTREVDSRTLESRRVPGLYFAGELLDVDGLCGGYNLQWAWSSGYVAGKEAAHAQSQSA